jgi:DNA-binding CsgD family transcriptional regulator
MLAALERVYAHHCASENHEECARAAFWCGLRNMLIGEVGLGSGWLQRAAKHAEQTPPDCVQRGYLLLPQVYMHRGKGAFEAAIEVADKAIAIGENADEPDLIAMAGSMKGGILFRLGRIDEGYIPIDEAMLLANSQRLSPVVSGVVYCEIVASCCRVLEMVRAREWTAILTDWCRRNPPGQGLQRRLPSAPGRGSATRGQLERSLRGGRARWAWPERHDRADRDGHRRLPAGRNPAAARRVREIRCRVSPGRRNRDRPAARTGAATPAQGRHEDAAAAIRRALETAGDMPRKTALLPAGIEIFIACGDLDAAERICGELSDIADLFGTEVLARVADQGHGLLALARGKFGDAVAALSRARRYWSEFGAPYLVAHLRVDIARGCAELGDSEGAEREFDAAEKVFLDLGAAPDLARIHEIRAGSKATGVDNLTARERQVLSLVADGGTNREIAEEVRLSPKTVNRHVENIFDKPGVASRAAAVAKALKTGSI